MKKHLFFFIALVVSQLVLAQKASFSINNPVNENRVDELIVLSRKQIEGKVGKLSPEKYIAVLQNSKTVFVQFDDLDADGVWDELCFLLNLQPLQQQRLVLNVTNQKPKVVGQQKAYVRQKRKNDDDSFGAALLLDSIPAGQKNTDFTKTALPPFLTEGPSWENDKVGFRIYFDVRHIIDIWGKTTADMVLDKVGVDPKVIYHHLDKWGMDILAVGSSLGAGSLALKYNDGSKDTLVRLGGDNMGKVIYEQVANGPVRAIFRMHYPQWKISNTIPPLELTQQISIWGGQFFYQNDIHIKNVPAGASLVTGIVNLKSKEVHVINNKEAQLAYTYDQQSENKDNLGMAVLLPKGEKFSVGKTPNENTDIKNTYYVAIPVTNRQPIQFRFAAAWELTDANFKTEEGFKKYIIQQSIQYLNPLEIK